MSVQRVESLIVALELAKLGATRRLLESYFGKTRDIKNLVPAAEIGRPKTSSVWLQNSVKHTLHANILWGLYKRINPDFSLGKVRDIPADHLVSVYRSYLLYVDGPVIDVNKAHLLFQFLGNSDVQARACSSCGEEFISHFMAMANSCPFCRCVTRFNKKERDSNPVSSVH